jgi:hypothetical protein
MRKTEREFAVCHPLATGYGGSILDGLSRYHYLTPKP